jgi:hypothetical protein
MRLLASSIYVGLMALLLVGLSVRVIRLRYRHKVEIGDGGVPELQRSIRAHANFIEYVPIALLLILTPTWSATRNGSCICSALRCWSAAWRMLMASPAARGPLRDAGWASA